MIVPATSELSVPVGLPKILELPNGGVLMLTTMTGGIVTVAMLS